MSSKYAYQLEDILSSGQQDLGEVIRKHIKTVANPINLTQEVADKVTKQIDSLERLAANTYGREYKRVYSSTATGLTAEQCNQVLSSETLQLLSEDSKRK